LETDYLNRFHEHPIKAYDPFYTRDPFLWECAWDDYRSTIKRRLESCETRRDTHPILTEFVETCDKIKVYERATGNCFISFIDSQGRMRQNLSYLRLLYG